MVQKVPWASGVVDGPFGGETVFLFSTMASVHKRFARDGCLYTQEEFFNWYGVRSARLFWDQAHVARLDSTYDYAVSAGDFEDGSVVFSFCFLSGHRLAGIFKSLLRLE